MIIMIINKTTIENQLVTAVKFYHNENPIYDNYDNL